MYHLSLCSLFFNVFILKFFQIFVQLEEVLEETINKIVFSEQFCVDWELYLEKVPQHYWARMQYWSQELLKKHNKF